MVFNYLGTQNSIESLNLRISSAWKYWLHNDAIAGFSTVYNESLSLFTVNVKCIRVRVLNLIYFLFFAGGWSLCGKISSRTFEIFSGSICWREMNR